MARRCTRPTRPSRGSAVTVTGLPRVLEAGRRRSRRALRRRRVILTSAILGLAVIATTASVVAVVMARQRQQVARERNVAEERRAQAQLEAARTAYVTRDLVSARALLRAALETRDSIAARSLWLQLRDDPVFWRRANTSPFNQLSYSPDGELVATGASDGLVYLFDAVTGFPRTLGVTAIGSTPWSSRRRERWSRRPASTESSASGAATARRSACCARTPRPWSRPAASPRTASGS